MGMIDNHIEMLKSYHNGFTGYAGNLQDSIDVAVDIMCKYQKIKEILKDDTYYEYYGSNAEKFIVSAICEVLKDGMTIEEKKD